LLFQPKHKKSENSSYISISYYNRCNLLATKRGKNAEIKRKRRRGGQGRRIGEKSLTKGSKSENIRKKKKDSPDRQKCKNWRGGAGGEKRRRGESLKWVKMRKYVGKKKEILTR